MAVNIKGVLSHCRVRVEIASHAHENPWRSGLEVKPTKEFTEGQSIDQGCKEDEGTYISASCQLLQALSCSRERDEISRSG